MTYSPGRWYITRLGNGPIVCAEGATPTDADVTCLDIVARVDWGRGKEDKANAKLIAAAPDLFKAAKLAVLNFRRSDAGGTFLGDDDHEAWTALLAAIAKAEK